jgi:PAS domain-containing protein
MIDAMKQEVEKKNAEERIKLMLDSAPFSCIFCDENFNMLDCNGETLKMFKLQDKHEFINNFYEFSPEHQPDGQPSKDKAGNYFNEALKKGRLTFEWMHQDSNGDPIPTEITLVSTKRQSDFILTSYIRDLRDIKAAQEEITEANERIRLMLDCTPLICILRDNENNFIDCNQEAVKVFGVINKSSLINNLHKTYPEFQPDGTRSIDKIQKILSEFIVSPSDIQHYEFTYQSFNGELIPAETLLVRIPWKDTYRYLSYSRDLREIRAKEKEIQEITERERKAEIQKEAALAANEEKSQFLANMSHEIRTPMNAVLGMTELLLHEKLTGRQSRYLKDIQTSATALLDIINDILDISKLQANKL